MDEKPNALETAINLTRSRLDRDLDHLGHRLDGLKESAAAQAQWWVGISAVAAGIAGAVWCWPRGGRRRGSFHRSDYLADVASYHAP